MGNAVGAFYENKPSSYFDNPREDIVKLLVTGPHSAILELGCGAGATGSSVLRAGKAGCYVGIEVNGNAARIAAEKLTRVLVGDVSEVDLKEYDNFFHALVAGEVLEHLVDPWIALRRLRHCLKPDAVVYASSPNIAHWRVVLSLLGGEFRYRESGVMDQTHLRWFTPQSYRALFEECGFEVLSLASLNPPGWKARMISALTFGKLDYLLMVQMLIVARRR